MKSAALLIYLLGLAVAHAQQNLVPNWNFSDPTPLKHWRVDFPYQDWYKKNVYYVKQVTHLGKRCAVIELPAGIAGNEGGKVETALISCEPGATYHAEVGACLPDFSAKIHAEVYAEDPRPDAQRTAEESKGRRITMFRIPPMDGKPALVQIYRAQFPDPKKGNSWTTTKRDFTVPLEWKIGAKKVTPKYIVLKAYTYEATMSAGKVYFGDFKLTKKAGLGSGKRPKPVVVR